MYDVRCHSSRDRAYWSGCLSRARLSDARSDSTAAVRARSILGAHPRVFSSLPALVIFFGGESWKLEESELCCVYRRLSWDASLHAKLGEKTDARMLRAAALSPEHISAGWSEHDRRLVQMPMSNFTESEQR